MLQGRSDLVEPRDFSYLIAAQRQDFEVFWLNFGLLMPLKGTIIVIVLVDSDSLVQFTRVDKIMGSSLSNEGIKKFSLISFASAGFAPLCSCI